MKGVRGDFWVLTIILEFANIRHHFEGERSYSNIERRDLKGRLEPLEKPN
jgi:hypothetical protein